MQHENLSDHLSPVTFVIGSGSERLGHFVARSIHLLLYFIVQGHPSTVFCKISVRISKYRLKFSTAPERLNISG